MPGHFFYAGKLPAERFLLRTSGRGRMALPAGPWHFETMTDEPPLAAEFPPASREDWLKLVRTALKDRPFERLIAKTYDGIPIEPLYGRRGASASPIAARRGPGRCRRASIIPIRPWPTPRRCMNWRTARPGSRWFSRAR